MTADVVLLLEENRIDPETPIGKPLMVLGSGLKNSDVPLPMDGWDELVEDDPYWVLEEVGGDVFLVSARTQHLAYGRI